MAARRGDGRDGMLMAIQIGAMDNGRAGRAGCGGVNEHGGRQSAALLATTPAPLHPSALSFGFGGWGGGGVKRETDGGGVRRET